MTYKNTGAVPKTFYGITFKPGETHDVSGFINDSAFVAVPKSSTKEVKPKQPEPKVEQTVENKPSDNKSQK